jgi:uncharacterized membrane protein
MSGHRREVSRVEGFSDAVFAFGITLLVVSLEVPKTFDELMLVVRGFPAFAVSFAMIFQVWWRHYRFFRNYDLEDSFVIVWTGVLLFVVLFYVYPLKFVWSLSFSGVDEHRVAITAAQAPLLFGIYGAGVIAVFSILAILYHHAYRLRDALGLTAREVVNTRVEVYRNLSVAGWGIASIAIAAITALLAPNLVGLAGYVYFGIGLSEWGFGEYRGRALKKLAVSTAYTSPA